MPKENKEFDMEAHWSFLIEDVRSLLLTTLGPHNTQLPEDSGQKTRETHIFRQIQTFLIVLWLFQRRLQ